MFLAIIFAEIAKGFVCCQPRNFGEIGEMTAVAKIAKEPIQDTSSIQLYRYDGMVRDGKTGGFLTPKIVLFV